MMRKWLWERLDRRNLLSGGTAFASGSVLGAVLLTGRAGSQGSIQAGSPEGTPAPTPASLDPHGGHGAHGDMTMMGDVDNAKNGFDPTALLTDWDTGKVSKLADGRTLRSYEIAAVDKEIEIAPGVSFPAWTYNGRVPGPAIRATEGDRLRITFRNHGSHPHSMHFHGIHSARVDGVVGAGVIGPGAEFVYEFDALPFGCHLYHCHALPLKRHMHKGMYGPFVIDPDPARHPEHAAVARSRLLGSPENRQWQELMMVMNGFDTDFDGKNEFYAANTVAHHFSKHPIRIVRSRHRAFLVSPASCRRARPLAGRRSQGRRETAPRRRQLSCAPAARRRRRDRARASTEAPPGACLSPRGLAARRLRSARKPLAVAAGFPTWTRARAYGRALRE